MSPTPTTLEEALAENARLRCQVQRLEELVAKLEARLNQNSQNSSKPPSTDGPGVKLPPKKTPSGRKPGGQPGHRGSRRELLPPEKVDKFEYHWPAACEKCRTNLPVRTRTEVGEPRRHQVAEIPAVRAHVTEHQMHTQCCDACGHTTQADLPDGVPAGAFGPTSAIGGIARTYVHNGNRIDIGGHRFFTKSERVMNWWLSMLPRQGAPAADDVAFGH